MTRLILPLAGVIGLVLLAMHQSGDPAILGRYSTDYALLLLMIGVHVALLAWQTIVPPLRKPWRGRRAPAIATSCAILFGLAVVLVDALVGLTRAPAQWVALVLIGLLLWRVARMTGEAGLRHAVVGGGVLVVLVAALELLFPYMATVKRVPRTQAEFQALVSAQWPETYAWEKARDTTRLLSVSDVYGIEGGNNYAYRMADYLEFASPPRVEVINVSMDPSDPPQQLQLVQLGLAYHPDVVIQEFFVGNDFNPSEAVRYELLDIGAVRQADESAIRPHDLLVRQWVLNAFRKHNDVLLQRSELNEGAIDRIGRYSRERFLQLQFERMQLWGNTTPSGRAWLSRVLPVLGRIADATAAAGAQYVLVIHPDQTQTDPMLQQRIRERFGESADVSIDQPQELLLEFCASRGLRCLDLRPMLIRRVAQEEVYGVRTTHYNRRGNLYVAQALHGFLVQEGLLPAGAERQATRPSEGDDQ